MGIRQGEKASQKSQHYSGIDTFKKIEKRLKILQRSPSDKIQDSRRRYGKGTTTNCVPNQPPTKPPPQGGRLRFVAGPHPASPVRGVYAS